MKSVLPPQRISSILLILAGFVFGLTVTGWIAAQEEQPPTKSKIDEKEEKNPPKLKEVTLDEKEEKTPSKLKEVPVDDDPVPKVKPKQPTTSVVPEEAVAVNLSVEAANAKHPIVRDMFNRLSTPYDALTSTGGTTIRVEPLERPWLELLNGSEAIPVVQLNSKGQPLGEKAIPLAHIKIVRSFEEIAVQEVSGFLRRKLEAPESPLTPALSRPDQLVAAEKVLMFAKKFHLAAVTSRRRTGDGWKSILNQLNAKLLEVQREQLRNIILAKQWDRAGLLAMQMGQEHEDDPGVQQEVYRIDMLRIEAGLKDAPESAYVQLREAVNQFERSFPGTKDDVVTSIKQRLRSKAGEYLRQAQGLATQGKQADAMGKLRTAELLDPELPELDKVRSTLKVRYPILYVGVRELPENLSPATALSDVEKRGVELIFESLIQTLPDLQLGRRYKPIVTRELPTLSPLTRDFQLVTNARWSHNDGKEIVDALDVRGSVQLMQELPDRWFAEGSDLLTVGEVNRNFSLQLKLRQGYLDPLSLMTFKVIPAKWLQQQGKRADNHEFATKPFGSGPYRYDGREKEENGRICAVFRANPYYGQRPGKLGLPNIREIRMYDASKLASPAEDFKTGQSHMLLDLPTSELAKIAPLTQNDNLVKVFTFRNNRRIHFLAVNHRRPVMQSADLRRGIAHAIQRNEILTSKFRDGDAVSKFHHSLVGPFPTGTWACPERAGDLYREQLAATLLSNRVQNQGAVKITLKYPNNDLAIGLACSQMKDQIEKLSQSPGNEGKITIELIGLTPSDLRRHVEVEHDFDLAYYTFDYRDDLFNLGGLLDPSASKSHGRNYMGYLANGAGADPTDRRLEQLLNELRIHRDFRGDLRGRYHELHRLFVDRMPFIPLWQLDRHMVVHRKLVIQFDDRQGPDLPTLLDPVTIFTQVQEWKLEE